MFFNDIENRQNEVAMSISINFNSLLLVCFIAYNIGCSPDEKAKHNNPNNDWGVSEKGYVITQGLYKANYEITNDGCSPSLASIKGELPDWPHDILFVPRDEDSASVTLEPFGLRGPGGNSLSLASMRLDKEDAAYFAIIKDKNISHREDVYCNGDLSEIAYSLSWDYDYRFESVSDNVLELRITSSWDVPERCGNGTDFWRGPAMNMWIPESTCTESYTISYTLDERCPDTCEVNVEYIEGEQSDPNNLYIIPNTSDGWCICE